MREGKEKGAQTCKSHPVADKVWLHAVQGDVRVADAHKVEDGPSNEEGRRGQRGPVRHAHKPRAGRVLHEELRHRHATGLHKNDLGKELVEHRCTTLAGRKASGDDVAVDQHDAVRTEQRLAALPHCGCAAVLLCGSLFSSLGTLCWKSLWGHANDTAVACHVRCERCNKLLFFQHCERAKVEGDGDTEQEDTITTLVLQSIVHQCRGD